MLAQVFSLARQVIALCFLEEMAMLALPKGDMRKYLRFICAVIVVAILAKGVLDLFT